MTERLVRTVARSPVRVLVRPSALAAFAAALAFGGGLWLQGIHRIEGAHEQGEPGFVVHWLRDATLSLPLVVAAVWLALLATRRLLDGRESRLMAGALLAATVSGVTSAILALAGPAHAGLFGAAHQGHELAPFAHMGRDGLLALVANTPIATAVAALLARDGRAWAAPDVGAWLVPKPAGARVALRGVLALVLLAPVAILAQSGAGIAGAQGGGAPCPAGAPVEEFDVVAINVKIPLNRFGHNDPEGRMFALRNELAAVREQERTQEVSSGLDYDPIQPLTLRANVGDCVVVRFENMLAGGERASMAFEGVSAASDAAGGSVGLNEDSSVAPGERVTYRVFIEDDTSPCPGHEQDSCSENEGAHYIHSYGTNFRRQIAHGLFGALVAEPRGARVLDTRNGEPTDHGWNVTIDAPGSAKDFRDFAIYYHEVGDETFRVSDADGGRLPLVDPLGTYRPGARAINYRSEPFFGRVEAQQAAGFDAQLGTIYSSYANGDPATPILREYLGDPVKMRIVHGGGEVMHVHHLHGGGDRWPFQPNTTPSNFGAGLKKEPELRQDGRESIRLDAQAIGPGDSFNTELAGGAGGVQQAVGDYLFHCHVNEHYEAGMFAQMRAHNTLQPDVVELPDRAGLMRAAVDSRALIGSRLPDGTVLTSDSVRPWVEGFLPPRGAPRDRHDGSVWDWAIEEGPGGPLYLREPESDVSTPNFTAERPGARLSIMFDPVTKRPEYPMLTPHIGRRPPFAPGQHGPTTTLHDRASPNFPDRLCPAGRPVRRFDVRVTNLPIPISDEITDRDGIVYTLAGEEAAMRSGEKPVEPLIIRANTGDCVRITFANGLEAGDPGQDRNGAEWGVIHPHLGQFDIQASDGLTVGFNPGQAVRPFRHFSARVAAPVAAGSHAIEVDDAGGFHEGAYLALGLEGDEFDVKQIARIAGQTIELTEPVRRAHAAGELVSDEFVNYELYFDFQAGTTYFHDHVKGEHIQRGMFGAYVIEPPGSEFRDPVTGALAPPDGTLTGTRADILSPDDAIEFGKPAAPFREQVLIFGDNQRATRRSEDSSGTWTSYRLEPLDRRRSDNGDPSLLFSSVTHGDPVTPLPRAYVGDDVVFRLLSGSFNHLNTFSLPGYRMRLERTDDLSLVSDARMVGQSERFDLVAHADRPGDFIWFNGINRHFRNGNWGIFRVHDRREPDLLPLPGDEPRAGPGGFPTLTHTGGIPPPPADPGNPCPADAPTKRLYVSLVETDVVFNDVFGERESNQRVFVLDRDLPRVRDADGHGIEPLVLHLSEGTCVEVRFTNRVNGTPASFQTGGLRSDPIGSGGITVGFNPQQAVEPGESRLYRLFADAHTDLSPIADFGNVLESWRKGAFGGVNVEPPGTEFRDPRTGALTDHGTQVIVLEPGEETQREYQLIYQDEDPKIGMDEMPYNPFAEGTMGIDYRSESLRGRARLDDGDSLLSSRVHGDPATPLLEAYAGDPVEFKVLSLQGEQIHSFSLDGHRWRHFEGQASSNLLSVRYFGPTEHFSAEPEGGAGGPRRIAGDYVYGDHRMPFFEGGLWGIFRVHGALQPELPTLAEIERIAAGGPVPARLRRPCAPERGRGPRLRVARRVAIRTLARRGLCVSLRLPRGSRAVDLRLYRGRRSGRAGHPVAARVMRVRRAGRIEVRWTLRRRELRRLRPGVHVLRVQPRRSGRARGAPMRARLRLSRPR